MVYINSKNTEGLLFCWLLFSYIQYVYELLLCACVRLCG